MSLIRFAFTLFLAAALSACTLEPRSNRYQQPAAQTGAARNAVDELQLRARDALARRDYALAIDYLQRAIRLEPRNPHSWHELAQVYRRSGDYGRCVEMVERSFSYSGVEDDLDHANQQLKASCQQGY